MAVQTSVIDAEQMLRYLMETPSLEVVSPYKVTELTGFSLANYDKSLNMLRRLDGLRNHRANFDHVVVKNLWSFNYEKESMELGRDKSEVKLSPKIAQYLIRFTRLPGGCFADGSNFSHDDFCIRFLNQSLFIAGGYSHAYITGYINAPDEASMKASDLRYLIKLLEDFPKAVGGITVRFDSRLVLDFGESGKMKLLAEHCIEKPGIRLGSGRTEFKTILCPVELGKEESE